MKKISNDMDSPVCRFMSEEKHPNIKNKRLITYTLNIDKIEKTLKAMKDGKVPEKDLSRSIQVSPSTADMDWFELIYDLDRPRKNLESPKSHILEIFYEHEKTGKEKKLKVFYDSFVVDLGHVYYFLVHNKEDAEYKLPFVKRSFLQEEIAIIKFEYRDANDNTWKLLGGRIDTRFL